MTAHPAPAPLSAALFSLQTGAGLAPEPDRRTEPDVLPVERGDREALPALRREATALPALVEADYDRPVTGREALAVLARFSLETGWTTTAERRAAIARALERAGYTRAAVELAGRDLALDPELTRRLGFPQGTVTPADFRRMIDGREGNAAAKTGLLTYPSALLRFGELGGGRDGSPLRFSEVFATVRLDGEARPRFREL